MRFVFAGDSDANTVEIDVDDTEIVNSVPFTMPFFTLFCANCTKI